MLAGGADLLERYVGSASQRILNPMLKNLDVIFVGGRESLKVSEQEGRAGCSCLFFN